MFLKKLFNAKMGLTAYLCIFFVSVVLFPRCLLAGQPDFKDLPVTSPVYPHIKFLAEKDLVKGYPDGNFMPEGQITRAEATALLVKAMGLSAGRPAGPTYSDVGPDHWAFGIVESAAAAGIIMGYPDGTFRPGNPVSRAEVAVLLLKLTREPLPSVKLPGYVTDVGPAHWAGQTIAAALRAGLLTMADSRSFLPDSPSTRAQMARGLAVMLNIAPEYRKVPLVGTLVPLNGEVYIKGSGGNFSRVTGSTACAGGMAVKTDTGGRAEIRFPDGSGLLLEQNTLLEIKSSEGQSTILRDGSPGVVVDFLKIDLTRGRIIGGLAAGYIYGREET
ncbi:MAG: S-layer homology domain-containing protein [Actinobacteria bacterium]|nr:S-layer homology domain-containing protein [Actinomycetota bacterium]